jgi:hypothetical protein
MKNLKKRPGFHEKRKDEDLAADIRADFDKRAEQKREYAAVWRLNSSFVNGNQHAQFTRGGYFGEYESEYFWQEREVFNHTAPIFETRLAKLGRVRPGMSVRPASADESDVLAGKTASKILESVSCALSLDKIIASATAWSELCGSSFYKVTWDENKGKPVGAVDGKTVYEGEVRVDVCPPHEIYPSSTSAESLNECESVIHAKAVPVEEIERVYGVTAEPERVEVYCADGSIADFEDGYCMMIERYVRPNPSMPEGEFSVCAGGKLLYTGPLPYQNGVHGERDFPFVQQCAVKMPGSFFGQSIIERIIPIQRAYNAVKNRKHEFLNRLAMGVLAVEDGSVDIGNLESEGLSPGKVLVYRQGSVPPRLLESGRVPIDFSQEEDRLLREFTAISGVSEIMRSSQTSSYGQNSGVAIQLLIEQDDTRLSVTADNIKGAIKTVGQQILRRYKQFALSGRLSRCVGENGEVELVYWSKSDISCDDVVMDSENEISQSPAAKQSMMLDLLKLGLLHDENGKIPDGVRYKIFDALGYGSWELTRETDSLNISKALKENQSIKNAELEVSEIDRHDLHISQHTKYALSPEFFKLCAKNPKLEERLISHIRRHKQFEAIEKTADKEDSAQWKTEN